MCYTTTYRNSTRCDKNSALDDAPFMHHSMCGDARSRLSGGGQILAYRLGQEPEPKPQLIGEECPPNLDRLIGTKMLLTSSCPLWFAQIHTYRPIFRTAYMLNSPLTARPRAPLQRQSPRPAEFNSALVFGFSQNPPPSASSRLHPLSIFLATAPPNLLNH